MIQSNEQKCTRKREHEPVTNSTDAWRQGRTCATCRYSVMDDLTCWRDGYEVPIPADPGHDEDDVRLIAPLDCWEPMEASA